MPSLAAQVLADFIARLTESGHIPFVLAQRLGEALGEETLPKPDDIVALYAEAIEEAKS